MKIKVSIDAVGHYLSSLVGLYNYKNGVPASDVNDYLPHVPNLLAGLRKWGDAPFIRAALVQLLQKQGLTEEVNARLCIRSQMDIDSDEMRPILAFMLNQIEKELSPLRRDDLDVEFVNTGHDETVWRSQRDLLNHGLVWFPPNTPASFKGRVESGQPCPRSGYWFTPAASNSRRYFKEGTVMPKFDSDYGDTIWQWSEDQNDPRLV